MKCLVLSFDLFFVRTLYVALNICSLPSVRINCFPYPPAPPPTTILFFLQLEWMSEDIGRAFDLQRSNPFELRNVHIMHSLEELDELGKDPKVCCDKPREPSNNVHRRQQTSADSSCN